LRYIFVFHDILIKSPSKINAKRKENGENNVFSPLPTKRATKNVSLSYARKIARNYTVFPVEYLQKF